MDKQEIWKDVKGYEGLYQASTRGRVRSISRSRVLEDHIMDGTTRQNGVRVLTLSKNGKKRQFTRSILIISTFYQRRSASWLITHIDGDLSNCALSNLKWKKRGTVAKARRGEDHPNAKLTDAEILAIRADPRSGRIIANDYGISRIKVSRIKNRRVWAHV